MHCENSNFEGKTCYIKQDGTFYPLNYTDEHLIFYITGTVFLMACVIALGVWLVDKK